MSKKSPIAAGVRDMFHKETHELQHHHQVLKNLITLNNGVPIGNNSYLFTDGSILALDRYEGSIVSVHPPVGWSLTKKVVVCLGGLALAGVAAAAINTLRN